MSSVDDCITARQEPDPPMMEQEVRSHPDTKRHLASFGRREGL